MSVTTVLFDLGGVVCRFRPERRLATLAAGCGLTPAEVRARVWESGFDADCDRGRFSAADVYGRVREMLGLQMGYQHFRATWSLAFEPDADVLDAIDAIRPHVRTGLLTDNGPVLLDAMAVLFPEVVRRFDHLLFSCELGALKPSAALFDAALARLKEPAGQVMLIDDSPRVIKGARECGLTAVQFTTVETLCADLAREL